MFRGVLVKCPYCAHTELKVLESREADEKTIRRRRQCLNCEKRFTTYEKIEMVELTIIKKDGKRVGFDKDKIRTGILKACEKRPIPREQIDATVQDIEMELRAQYSTELPSKLVGELVMKKLRKLDKVAYIRFASVYRDFTDIESFEKELKTLLKRR